MHEPRVSGTSYVPAVATALAVGTLAGPFLPVLFPLVLACGAAAACALALLRRPSRALALAFAGVALWLVAGVAGAWALRDRPLAGLAWVVVVLFLLPLPLLPWLYSRTFAEPADRAPVAGGTPEDTGDGGDA
jgi:hypothetical protein